MISRKEQRQDPVSVPPLPCALNLPSSSVFLSNPPPPPYVASPRRLTIPIVSLIASYCLLIYSFSLQHPNLLLPRLASLLPIVGFFWRTSWEEESFCEPPAPHPTDRHYHRLPDRQTDFNPKYSGDSLPYIPFFLRLSVALAGRRTLRRTIRIGDSQFVLRRGLERQQSEPDPPSTNLFKVERTSPPPPVSFFI